MHRFRNAPLILRRFTEADAGLVLALTVIRLY